MRQPLCTKKKFNALKQKERLQLFLLIKGSIFRKILPGLILILLINATVAYLHLHISEFKIINLGLSSALPGYMGAALGLLLVFRNNTAYERWWEGRKEIGALVNTCRNISIAIENFLPNQDSDKQKLIDLVNSFVFALKDQLRDKNEISHFAHLAHFDNQYIQNAKHKPVAISNVIQKFFEKLVQENKINDFQYTLLTKKNQELIDILGKCERIKSTPIPMAYGVLLKFFIHIYAIGLPFTFIDVLGFYCTPFAGFVFFVLMSIVLTAEEIEDPFGTDINDLKFDIIAHNITQNTAEISNLN